jgi:ABC-type oligopeptide transport system substrate-binding subunit
LLLTNYSYIRTRIRKSNNLKSNKMKKVLSIVAASAMLAIVACGPSAEEKAKLEAQKQADSIAAATRAADSLAALEGSMVDTTAVSVDTTAAATTELPH